MNTKLTGLQGKLIEIFERSSGIDVGTFDNDTTFLEMGMDSLFLSQLAMAIKKDLKVTITFRQLMEDYASINLLSNYLLDKVEFNGSSAPKVTAPIIMATTKIEEAVKPIPTPVIQPPQMVQVPVQRVRSTSGSSLENIINRQIELMSQQIMLLNGTQITSTLPVAVETQSIQVQELYVPEAMAAAPQVAPVKKKVSVSNVKEAFGAQARITTEKNAQLTADQTAKIKNFVEKYTAKTKSSKKFTQDNPKNHSDPRAVTGFKPEAKEIVYPIVVKKSYLQTLWDLDDNKYIDMTCGFGSNFFGNGNEVIKKFVIKQIEEGIEIGPQHPLVSEVSNLINEMTGSERVAFCNTGSESVLGAMRIARTVTGREKIIVFSGSYHGINDEVILRGSKSGNSYPAASGINNQSVSNMIVLDYGTAESLQVIREMAADVAAVLVEPVQSRRCDFHPVEFLKEVRKITLASNTCLIFDEIITGFRVHPAGAQGYFGIKADLCTYGKIIGGGLPIGVIAGKSEYMDALDGGHWQYGDDSTPTVGVTYFAGTFCRHPLALASARGALEVLRGAGAEGLHQLNKRAQKFADDLNLFLLTENAPIKMDNFGSLMKPKWTADIASGDLLFAILRYNGVHVYDGFPWFVNLAHTEQDLVDVLNAFKDAVRNMQALGLFPSKIQTTVNEIALDTKVFDQKGAPMIGAKLGQDEKGNPAWFVEDPENAGEYYLLKG
jgi:glutamate-1-semialdehyde aminotransferase/acyl carrier protein